MRIKKMNPDECRHEWIGSIIISKFNHIHQTPNEDRIGLNVTCPHCGASGIEWFKYEETAVIK